MTGQPPAGRALGSGSTAAAAGGLAGGVGDEDLVADDEADLDHG